MTDCSNIVQRDCKTYISLYNPHIFTLYGFFMRQPTPKQTTLSPPLSGGFQFTLDATDGFARAGTITTPHGVIQTPIFMPVGTRSAVK